MTTIESIDAMMKAVFFEHMDEVVLFLQEEPNEEAKEWIKAKKNVYLVEKENLWIITKKKKNLETRRAKETIQKMKESQRNLL